MTIAKAALPLVTADIPGTGGSVRECPEDFRVEEIPVYEPTGHGDHVLATVEKIGRSTPDLVQAMARALGIRARDVGTAGMKDRHAVTRQRVSFPPPVSPEAVAALELPGVRVLATERHPHKLRTGHLAGNRFVLRLRQTDVAADEAAARARASLESLARAPGCPNWYGAQRFGAGGDNAARGRELVTGARSPGSEPPRRRRLLVSAYQSMLFNEHLRRRIADGLLRVALEGDILRPVRSRSVFFCESPEAEQARLERGEIVGPSRGRRARRRGTRSRRVPPRR